MAITSKERLVLERIKYDGAFFLKHCLGKNPYMAQVDQFNAVIQGRRTSVCGCNGSGKDWTTGCLILHYMLTHAPCKVVVVGPTYRQVNDVVFNELRSAVGGWQMAYDIGFQLPPKAPRMTSIYNPEEWFAVGVATANPMNLQGYHADDLLVVVTEAHNVQDDHMQAVKRLNPTRILLTGNAFANQGEFYDSHHTRRHSYTAYSISAFDSPNLHPKAPKLGWPGYEGLVNKTIVEERADEWGTESPMYRASVLGQFAEDLDTTMVSLSWAMAAVSREVEESGQTILGVDVARFGTDKSVIYLRRGGYTKLLWRIQGHNTVETFNQVMRFVAEYNADVVVVDGIGVGAGVVDMLNESPHLRNTTVVDFQAGSSPSDKDHFSNAIAEAWWLMRKAFQNGEISIENDPALIGQITGREYHFVSEAKIALEPKAKLLKSPDEADALAMTYVPFYGVMRDTRPPRATRRSRWRD